MYRVGYKEQGKWGPRTTFGMAHWPTLTVILQLIPRTTDTQSDLFVRKSQTFRLGQTNWAEKFWGIWSIFGLFISTHFGTVGPLSKFSINQTLFVQKN